MAKLALVPSTLPAETTTLQQGEVPRQSGVFSSRNDDDPTEVAARVFALHFEAAVRHSFLQANASSRENEVGWLSDALDGLEECLELLATLFDAETGEPRADLKQSLEAPGAYAALERAFDALGPAARGRAGASSEETRAWSAALVAEARAHAVRVSRRKETVAVADAETK